MRFQVDGADQLSGNDVTLQIAAGDAEGAAAEARRRGVLVSSVRSLEEELTDCPACGETVKAKAVKCRFCGEPLRPVSSGARRDTSSAVRREEIPLQDKRPAVMPIRTSPRSSESGAHFRRAWQIPGPEQNVQDRVRAAMSILGECRGQTKNVFHGIARIDQRSTGFRVTVGRETSAGQWLIQLSLQLGVVTEPEADSLADCFGSALTRSKTTRTGLTSDQWLTAGVAIFALVLVIFAIRAVSNSHLTSGPSDSSAPSQRVGGDPIPPPVTVVDAIDGSADPDLRFRNWKLTGAGPLTYLEGEMTWVGHKRVDEIRYDVYDGSVRIESGPLIPPGGEFRKNEPCVITLPLGMTPKSGMTVKISVMH